jgi:hypothetical protein
MPRGLLKYEKELSLVIGEKSTLKNPSLIGRGCQPPAPLDREASAKAFD